MGEQLFRTFRARIDGRAHDADGARLVHVTGVELRPRRPGLCVRIRIYTPACQSPHIHCYSDTWTFDVRPTSSRNPIRFSSCSGGRGGVDCAAPSALRASDSFPLISHSDSMTGETLVIPKAHHML